MIFYRNLHMDTLRRQVKNNWAVVISIKLGVNSSKMYFLKKKVKKTLH